MPVIPEGCDTLKAALTYAAAGLYVVPVKRGTKHPGSVLGDGWQHKSTRDPEQIVAHWAGTDHGVAIHAGRSGAVVFDLDHPERVPAVLAEAVERCQPPRQRTRRTGERGHVMFAVPAGRTLGNSTGGLGKGWGEVRGQAGVIVVAPSEHPERDGQYTWASTGPVPVLPDDVAALLPEAGPATDAATDTAVAAFLAEHVEARRPAALQPALDHFAGQVRSGASRHDAARDAACWVAREAAAGWYGAAGAFAALGREFAAALGGDRPSRPEFAGIMAWAVGQVTPEQVEAKRAALHPAEGQEAPQEPAAATPATVRPSWEPLDLTEFLDGSHRPLAPTLLPRTDGACLLYPGKVHSVHGESESGKSFVLQAEAARLLSLGERVVIVDYESTAATVVGRLLEMGAPAEAVRAGLAYIRPERSPADLGEREAWGTLLGRPAALVVLDGVTEALSTMGRSTIDNDEVTTWMRRVPRAIAHATGAAVVLVDHVTKSTEGRGRFAIGAQAKLSALDGASYSLEVVEPLGRGLRGVLRLWVGKDREGSVRPVCGRFSPADRTQLAATIVVDSTAVPIVTEVQPPEERVGTERKPFVPSFLMEKLSRALEASPVPLSGNALVKESAYVTGKKEAKAQGLRLLVDGGYVAVTDGPNRTRLHTSAKAYREGAQPREDQGPTRGVVTSPIAPQSGGSLGPAIGAGTRDPHESAFAVGPGPTRDPLGPTGTHPFPGAAVAASDADADPF